MRVQIVLSACVLMGACASTPGIYTPPEPMMPHGWTLDGLRLQGLEIDISGSLTPDELAVIAVYSNVELKALRSNRDVAEAQIFAARLLPDPTISMGFDVPLSAANTVTALATGIGTDLSSLSSQKARLSSSNLNRDKIDEEILWAEWLTAEQAKLLALRVSRLEVIFDKTLELQSLAETDLNNAIRAAVRGDIPASEVDARRLSAADAADRARAIENQLATNRLELNRVLGLDPEVALSLAASSASRFSNFQLSQMYLAAVEIRPDLKAMRLDLQNANTGIAIAKSSRFPLPSLDFNGARDTGGLKTLGAGIGLTLPIWNRGRGDISIAKADLSRLEAEYRARLETVRADMALALSTLDISHRQLSEVATSLIGIEEQAKIAEDAAARGDIAQTVATATRMAALDKSILTNNLALAVDEAFLALEIVFGQPLETHND